MEHSIVFSVQLKQKKRKIVIIHILVPVFFIFVWIRFQEKVPDPTGSGFNRIRYNFLCQNGMKRFNVLFTGENGQNWDHLPLRRGLNKTYPLSLSGLIKKTLFNPPYKVLLSESKIELEIKETSGIFWAVRLLVSCGSTYVRLGDYGPQNYN